MLFPNLEHRPGKMLFADRVRHPANNGCRCRREANAFFWLLTESFALFKRWRREMSPDTPTSGMLRDLAVRWARRTDKHSSNVSHGNRPGVSREWHRPGRGDESCRRRARFRNTDWRSCARGPVLLAVLGANLCLCVS